MLNVFNYYYKTQNNLEVDFLAKKAYQTASSATLARKFDAYIVPLAIFNQENYTYKIKIYEPIVPFKTENEEEDIDSSDLQKIIEGAKNDETIPF